MKNKHKETDWDSYYSKPYKTATVTRKITQARLIQYMKEYAGADKNTEICELGGANSCFFNAIQERVKPKNYVIIDNNQLGLDKFEERIGKRDDVGLFKADVLDMQHDGKFDLVFSVGLIEHFSVEGTAKAIKSHFKLLKPGGTAIITFPTPTFLYKATRFFAELFGMWIFHDERPLKFPEVLSVIEKQGKLSGKEIIWPIILTQGIVAARKSV